MTHAEDTLEILTRGKMEVKGQFLPGSNYTFLVTLRHQGRRLKAVYKPHQGGMPLFDFEADSLGAREAAAYVLSEALGWELVPPTVVRRSGPFGAGSLQEFIPHNPEETYFSMSAEERSLLRPAALFDLMANNADRKGSHILRDRQGRIRLIDHGLCFHTEPKLRTVIWDFRGQAIPDELLADAGRLADMLAAGGEAHAELAKLISSAEIEALLGRTQALLENAVFPEPDPERRPFPWPLV